MTYLFTHGCVDRGCEKGLPGPFVLADDTVGLLCDDDETDMTEYLDTCSRLLEDIMDEGR